MHWACYSDRPSVLTLLLDAGASIYVLNKSGDTPLMTAAAEDSAGCVGMLLARGGHALDMGCFTARCATLRSGAGSFAAGRSYRLRL